MLMDENKKICPTISQSHRNPIDFFPSTQTHIIMKRRNNNNHNNVNSFIEDGNDYVGGVNVMNTSNSTGGVNRKSSASTSASLTSSKITNTILFIIIGSLIGLIVYQKNQFNLQQIEMTKEIQFQTNMVQKLESQMDKFSNELMNDNEEKDISALKQSYESSIQNLKKEVTSLKQELEDTKTKNYSNDNNDNEKLLEQSRKEVQNIQKQYEHLKEEVQRHDKHAVLDKYGEGPHRLEIQLDFPPEEIPEGSVDKFIIEMAPLDLMPHTVHFFLEQASNGLLDGCSFHRNAGHVVQGGPIANHLNRGVNLRKPFVDHDLFSVSFQEYHPDFPHVKYTLGYAGRPGGPDFYVSTINNTRNHGPGGQSSYEIASEADPCFAKVVEGFEAVDRMQKMSVQPGGYKRMKNYVAIKSVKILKGGL